MQLCTLFLASSLSPCIFSALPLPSLHPLSLPLLLPLTPVSFIFRTLYLIPIHFLTCVLTIFSLLLYPYGHHLLVLTARRVLQLPNLKTLHLNAVEMHTCTSTWTSLSSANKKPAVQNKCGHQWALPRRACRHKNKKMPQIFAQDKCSLLTPTLAVWIVRMLHYVNISSNSNSDIHSSINGTSNSSRSSSVSSSSSITNNKM